MASPPSYPRGTMGGRGWEPGNSAHHLELRAIRTRTRFMVERGPQDVTYVASKIRLTGVAVSSSFGVWNQVLVTCDECRVLICPCAILVFSPQAATTSISSAAVAWVSRLERSFRFFMAPCSWPKYDPGHRVA